MSEMQTPYLHRGQQVKIKELDLWGRIKSYQQAMGGDKIYLSVEYFEKAVIGKKQKPRTWFGTLDQVEIGTNKLDWNGGDIE